MDIHNSIAEAFARKYGDTCTFLDKDNKLWKVVDGEWVSKPAVLSKDKRWCWVEDIMPEAATH